jgi:glycosyltransferase involved in cell wall biosynthesis
VPDNIKNNELIFSSLELEGTVDNFLDHFVKDPNNPEFLNYLGEIYFHCCEINRSLKCLYKALRLNPHYRDVIINLSIVLKNINRSFELKPIVELYLEKFPLDKQIELLLIPTDLEKCSSNKQRFKYIMTTEIPILLKHANPQGPFKDITLIMPSYNRVDLLTSDLIKGYKFGKQTKVIVDDFSHENQQQKLSQLAIKHSDIHVIYHDKNQGVAQAYRTGVEQIKTPYVQFLDDDDILLCKDKDRLNEVILKLNESYLLIPRYIFNLYPDGTLREGYDRSAFESVPAEKILFYLCKTGEMHLLKNGGIFHIEDIKNALPETIFKISEDYVMLARILAKNFKKSLIISDDFYYLRRVNNNTLSKKITNEKLILHLLSILIAAYYCIQKKMMTRSIFMNHFKNRIDLLHRLYKLKNEIFNVFDNYINCKISIDQFIIKLNFFIPTLSHDNLPHEISLLTRLQNSN